MMHQWDVSRFAPWQHMSLLHDDAHFCPCFFVVLPAASRTEPNTTKLAQNCPQTDRVTCTPFKFDFTQGVWSGVADRLEPQPLRRTAILHTRWFGAHLYNCILGILTTSCCLCTFSCNCCFQIGPSGHLYLRPGLAEQLKETLLLSLNSVQLLTHFNETIFFLFRAYALHP